MAALTAAVRHQFRLCSLCTGANTRTHTPLLPHHTAVLFPSPISTDTAHAAAGGRRLLGEFPRDQVRAPLPPPLMSLCLHVCMWVSCTVCSTVPCCHRRRRRRLAVFRAVLQRLKWQLQAGCGFEHCVHPPLPWTLAPRFSPFPKENSSLTRTTTKPRTKASSSCIFSASCVAG